MALLDVVTICKEDQGASGVRRPPAGHQVMRSGRRPPEERSCCQEGVMRDVVKEIRDRVDKL